MSRHDTYYVYIMTNKGRTTLYIGVTNSLLRRVHQHREGSIPGFTSRYNLNRLVYYEVFRDIKDAIAREKTLKGWRRDKKASLIESKNKEWADLSVTVLGMEPAPSTQWHDRQEGCQPERNPAEADGYKMPLPCITRHVVQ